MSETLAATSKRRRPPKFRPVLPPPPSQHLIAPDMLGRGLVVTLVGAGGNGSRMLTGLAQLDAALRALGHPGLLVTVYDPDNVSEANIGRQLFYPSDVGQNKATLLVTRVNLCYGLQWVAVPGRFPDAPAPVARPTDILITCVDSAKARREVHAELERGKRAIPMTPHYWLDLANETRFGQVILGQPKSIDHKRYLVVREPGKEPENLRLPIVTEVFPALLDEGFVESDTPSCSVAEALQKQDLFINGAVSVFALDLLWRLLRTGRLEYCGCYINLETGVVNPIPVGQGLK